LYRNCLLKHVIDGTMEKRIVVTGRRGRRGKQLLDVLKNKRGYWIIERGNTRSMCVENWLWKKIWTCSKTDC